MTDHVERAILAAEAEYGRLVALHGGPEAIPPERLRAVAAVLDELRPDVVLAMSDQLAAGALDVLGATARVSGWDDSELAGALGFSSVRQSLFDQGVACARVAAGLTATVDPVPWELALR